MNWCAAAALICGLSACQHVSQSVRTQPTSTPAQANLGSVSEQSDEPDIVGDLIAQVEDQEITTDQELEVAAIRPAAPLPEDQGRSQLAEQALNAALGLLKTKRPEVKQPVQPFSLPEKQDTRLRIGLLLPLSGDYTGLGKDIAGGCLLYTSPSPRDS